MRHALIAFLFCFCVFPEKKRSSAKRRSPERPAACGPVPAGFPAGQFADGAAGAAGERASAGKRGVRSAGRFVRRSGTHGIVSRQPLGSDGPD